MSKVYDNGTMRTATAEEEQNINMNIGGGTDRWELVDTKTITEDTGEYICTFDSKKYDDVLIVLKNLNGTKKCAAQIRFKYGQYYYTANSTAITLEGLQDLNVVEKFEKVVEGLYLVENIATTTTNTINFINNNVLGEKIDSVRVNATAGFYLTSGTIQIYGKVRSEFL